MTLPEISNTRLISQKITAPGFKTPVEIVNWMGAIQAQDYPMAKWAIGIRLPDPSEKSIEAALDKGEILRIHVLRPTWHFISADDIHWMIRLTAQKVKSSTKSRHKQLELTDNIITKSLKIIEKNLADGNSLTRDELAAEFHKARIKTDENRLSHIMLRAELEGIVCSGPIKGKKLTFALLSDRVPKKKDLNRDESIAKLAKKYFTSHCPATVHDFAWWSNLPVTEIRKAVESLKSEFITETIDKVQYLLPNSFTGEKLKKTSVHLLPAYDEFLISYKDRSSSLSILNTKKTVSSNGIFYPPVVVDGQVAGLWKRTIQKDKVAITVNLFQAPEKKIKTMIEKQAVKFGEFLDKETEIIIKVIDPE